LAPIKFWISLAADAGGSCARHGAEKMTDKANAKKRYFIDIDAPFKKARLRAKKRPLSLVYRTWR
jgi:hypothetical protein